MISFVRAKLLAMRYAFQIRQDETQTVDKIDVPDAPAWDTLIYRIIAERVKAGQYSMILDHSDGTATERQTLWLHAEWNLIKAFIRLLRILKYLTLHAKRCLIWNDSLLQFQIIWNECVYIHFWAILFVNSKISI